MLTTKINNENSPIYCTLEQIRGMLHQQIIIKMKFTGMPNPLSKNEQHYRGVSRILYRGVLKDVSTKLGRRSSRHLNHIKDIREVQDV